MKYERKLVNKILASFLCLSPLLQLDPVFASAIIDKKSICRKMKIDEWQNSIALKKNPPIIFFASWCSSCEEKLEKFSKLKAKEIYFIAVFDQFKQSEIVAKKYGLLHCIVDEDESIARYYKIKSLPAQNINI